jgi:hypothetical protein
LLVLVEITGLLGGDGGIVALCSRQHLAQRHSNFQSPSGSLLRVRRQPKRALMSVWFEVVSGARVEHPTHMGRSLVGRSLMGRAAPPVPMEA